MKRQNAPGITRIVGIAALLSLVFASFSESQAPQLVIPKKDVSSVLDGQMTGSDAYTVTDATSPPLTFYIKTYRGVDMTGAIDEQIQLYLSVVDNTPDVMSDVTPTDLVADTIRITFDIDNDHQLTAADRTVLILRKPSVVACAACVKVGDWNLMTSANLPSSQWRIVNTNSQWSAEIQIKAADLGLNSIPSLIGMGIRVRDTGQFFGVDHPSTNVALWDRLRSRNPIDFAIVLDNSGSMLLLDGLADSRWARAKRAADLFAAAIALFPDLNFDDHIAISQYAWTCGDPSPSGDITGAVSGLPGLLNFGPIPSVPTDPAPSYTAASTAAPLPNNCTPIQRGLE